MNLNIWKKELSVTEMEQMTKNSVDSFKCGPIVVQESKLILRWRDLLHYSSSGLCLLILYFCFDTCRQYSWIILD